MKILVNANRVPGWVAGLAVACSAGCHTYNPMDYVNGTRIVLRKAEEPTAGPVARVRLSSDGRVLVYPESSCVNAGSSKAGVGVGSMIASQSYAGVAIGVPGTEPAGLLSGEMRLRADVPVTLQYTHTRARNGHLQTCTVERTFVPQADADYQVIARVDPVNPDAGCSMEVVRLRPQFGLVAAEPTGNCK